MDELIIESLLEINVPLWDEFCIKHSHSWLNHTSKWKQYCIASRFDVKVVDVSFLIKKGNIVLAIVPLLIENINGIKEFSFSSGPSPFYLILESLGKKDKKMIEKIIWGKIKKIALENGVLRYWVRYNVHNDSFVRNPSKINPLLSLDNLLDTTIKSVVLDLTQTENSIISNMTKGHKSKIKKGLKDNRTQTIFFTSKNIVIRKIWEFRDFYFLIAGKITRPKETFEIIYDFILSNNAILVETKYQSTTVAFNLVLLYKNYAYYAMSAVENDYKVEVGSQIIQWQIILFLKKCNVIFYELGEQYLFSDLFFQPTEKEKNISLYKRGYGGILLSQYSAEYFFLDAYFKDTFEKRISKYLENKALREDD